MNLPALLLRLTAGRPSRVIQVRGKDYLERIHLFALLGWEFALHRFLSGDGDAHLHDHPWRGVSLILSGGYMEHRAQARAQGHLEPGTQGPRFRRVGELVPLDLDSAHRIVWILPDTWTLVAHGPRIRDWGFYEAGAWIRAAHQSESGWWKACTSRRQRRTAAVPATA